MEETPKNWLQLTELLFEGSWNENLRRHRSGFLFRGSSLLAADLATSLQLGGFERHERHLLRSFRKYALRSDVPQDSEWNWLSLAKHHGLPTRLLDWSYSPFVALHFATRDPKEFDRDGCIWCVDFARTNELLPASLRRILDENGTNIFTTEMINSVAPTLDTLKAFSEAEFVLFFEPPSLDDRIVNQFALFSLPSRADLLLNEFLDGGERLYRKILIPASLKWEIRDKLDQANITERVLFPGLDGLTAWLKRYFTTRTD